MGGDAQKEAAGMDELQLGDLVQMRKTHPCGSDKWTVIEHAKEPIRGTNETD